MLTSCTIPSNISFLPIVLLALVFNVTNVVGFTYADRDSKRKWASGMAASSMFGSIGGVGGSIVSGLGESSSSLPSSSCVPNG